MNYEWDAVKAAANLAKHGISFERIKAFGWLKADIQAAFQPNDPEVRLKATGMIGNRVYVVIYVIRRKSLRLISLRPASKQETRAYDDRQD